MGQKVTTPPAKERENDILTPEAPSIAFPLANPPAAPEPRVKLNIYIKNTFLYTCFNMHPMPSLSNKLLVLKGSFFLSGGTQGRKAASQISAVLPQPSGTHWLQSPHRGAWWAFHLIRVVTVFHHAAVEKKATHHRPGVRAANPWWLKKEDLPPGSGNISSCRCFLWQKHVVSSVMYI